MAIFRRGGSEGDWAETERFHVQEGSPEIMQLSTRVNNKLHAAFGDDVLNDPESFAHKITSDTLLDMGNVVNGKTDRVSIEQLVSTNDPETDALIDGLARTFGVELPEPGVAGLRSLLAGLREQGDSRKVTLPGVVHPRERRFTEEDVIAAATEPTIVGHESTGPEKLIVTSPDETNARLVFSGLGLTHPNNREDNPMYVEVVLLAGDESLKSE